MGLPFQVNRNLTYVKNPQVEKNTFIGRKLITGELPAYEDVKDMLPKPVFDGHNDVIECYNKAWELAFGNLRHANADAGFVSDFIDTAFNGFLFMYDSAFIVMFGKYAERFFNFQQTLDNFYSHQHKDGFICREICESEPGEQFSRDDPASTGPNVLPWAEWEYYLSTGDINRLSRVFDPLCAYHRWLQLNRSWPDGSYWSCGLSNGMDNSPRPPKGYDSNLSHGFMSWVDTCAQQYLSAITLIDMSKVLGRADETAWLKDEAKLIADIVNNTMWSEKDGFYYDKYRDGTLSDVKTAGAYWALLAGLVPGERLERFVAHLNNENEFKRPNRVPTLSADSPFYEPNGGYWRGSVWAPTNYMILAGLRRAGCHRTAYEIACDYLKNVVDVFNETGTLFENYAPERAAKGDPAMPDFVGWTGLAPISILFEYVFGIIPDAQNRKITWYINRTERHGIMQYPLGDATVNLICESRGSDRDKPVVRVTSDRPVTVKVIWSGGDKTVITK